MEPVALSDQPAPMQPSSAAGVAGLIAANASLLLAGLVYMGWAYTNALWGYFHVNPLDLGVSIPEYVMRGLSLFSLTVVVGAVVLITFTTVRAWNLNAKRFSGISHKVVTRLTILTPQLARLSGMPQPANRQVLISAGTTMTVTSVVMFWLSSRIYVNTYLLLGLLGGGPLIMTWPTRAHCRGRFPHALAIVVAAICTLSAGSIYADELGAHAAQNFVRGLPAATAVAVYSIQPLALSGPGVTVQRLSTAFRYHYCYEGLRLLIYRSGTYYLLPVRWSPQLDLTYVLDDSDAIRVELYSGERPS
jgi:hypothetical protein